MRYVSEEELRKWILKEGCDEGCGYIDERDLEQMQWVESPNNFDHKVTDFSKQETGDREEMLQVDNEISTVLKAIRSEIEERYGHCDICEYFEDYDYEENDISEYRAIGNISDILQIIDKYIGDT